MIKILDLDGFKFIGSNFNNYEHIPQYSNLRKNCTYIHLTTTNWEKDKYFLEFLEIHIKSIEIVKRLIEKRIEEEPEKRTFHIVIRQDDDNEDFYGMEQFYVGYTRPKNIKEYIKRGKIFSEQMEESEGNYTNHVYLKDGKLFKNKVRLLT